MKILMLCSILFIASCSSKRGKNNQLTVKLDSFPQIANITVERMEPSTLFPILLDSANKFKPGDSTPQFFYNYLLDYEHPWLTDHRELSLRKMIFDSTSNKDVLNAILMSNDFRLKKIADSAEVSDKSLLHALPYRGLSNYEMARIRLSELK